jgi:hypothetical protein
MLTLRRFGRLGRHVTALQDHAAGVGCLESAQNAQRRRLAAARGAEKGHELTLCDVEGQVMRATALPNRLDIPSMRAIGLVSAIIRFPC